MAVAFFRLTIIAMSDSISQRIKGWSVFFTISDTVALTICFLISNFVWSFKGEVSLLPPAKDLVVLAIALAAIAVHHLLSERQGQDVLCIFNGRCLQAAAKQILVITVPLLFYISMWRDYWVSRFVVIFFLMIGAPVLYLSKILLRNWISALSRSRRPRLRVLAVVDSDDKALLDNWFEVNRALGIELCGTLVLPNWGDKIEIIEQRLEESVSSHRPELVIWALETNARRTARLRRLVEKHGAHLGVDLGAITGRQADVVLANYPPFSLVCFHNQPLINPANNFAKSALDLAVSLPVIVFVLPVMCAGVWLLHRMVSPGPLFFKQKRSGVNGSVFWVRKFRTMHCNHGQEAKQARHNDSRIFPGGALLRKLSIDELPQFLNVLTGDMSVVGPRPHMPEHDELFARDCEQYLLRHAVKPGITGLAQVRGLRGPIDDSHEVRARVSSDLEYCSKWTVFLDLSIIFRTFFHMFSFHPKSC